jgi:hypothetical protein
MPQQPQYGYPQQPQNPPGSSGYPQQPQYGNMEQMPTIKPSPAPQSPSGRPSIQPYPNQPMQGFYGPANNGLGHEMMVLMHGPAGASEGFTKFLRDLMARSKQRDQMQYHPNIMGMMDRVGRNGGY